VKLGITRRQLERLLLRYKARRRGRLVSRSAAWQAINQLPVGVAERAVALIRERYVDFVPTLAREKLDERHGISLGLETVRRLMISAGLWKTPPSASRQDHQPRNRRAC